MSTSRSRRITLLVVALTVFTGIAFYARRQLMIESRPGAVAPTHDQPEAPDRPVYTFEMLAEGLESAKDDPAAATRLRQVAQALASGEMKEEQANGIPIMATVIPAWWLERSGILEISVMVLGQAGVTYALLLEESTQPGTSHRLNLVASQTRDYVLPNNLRLIRYQSYVDEQWKPLGPSMPPTSSYVDPSTSKDHINSNDRLEANRDRWNLRVGQKTIPLVIPARPTG
jgi:hypothetical protein